MLRQTTSVFPIWRRRLLLILALASGLGQCPLPILLKCCDCTVAQPVPACAYAAWIVR
jgi:hypothetical protein